LKYLDDIDADLTIAFENYDLIGIWVAERLILSMIFMVI